MLLEAGGLTLVIAVSLPYWGAANLLEFPARPETEAGLPLAFLAQGIVLTFYAFIGFEDSLNVAEELKNPRRNLPLGLVMALVLTVLIYMSVAISAVSVVPWQDLAEANAPPAEVVARAAPWFPAWVFIVITVFAVASLGTSHSLVERAAESRASGWVALPEARGDALQSFADVRSDYTTLVGHCLLTPRGNHRCHDQQKTRRSHMNPPRLFISYSHQDEPLLREFTAHLSPLVRNGTIETWDDRELVVGDDLDERLRSELESADLVAFLVSADFLQSVSCYEDELLNVLKHRPSREIDVLPVILRDCLWSETPLAAFLAVPKDGDPVADAPSRDAAWVDVATQIKARVERWQAERKRGVSRASSNAKSFAISAGFQSWLSGTEISFQHKAKERVRLPDLYVYPDIVGSRDHQHDTGAVNSTELLRPAFLGDGVLVHGEEQSGKTSLAKMLFGRFLSQDMLPLYLDAKEATSANPERRLRGAVAEQYDGIVWEEYRSSSRDRVLLLDDYHDLRLNARYERRYIDALAAVFRHVVLIADSSLTVNEKRMVDLASFRRWEIQGLGHARRGELIERWNSLGQEETIDIGALHRKNDEMTRNLNSVMRKNLLPPRPIFVLTVIQLLDSTAPTNFELSSYGHCYQALILQALNKVGIKAQEFDSYVNYLSELAHSCFSHGGEALTGDQFDRFKRGYTKRFVIESHDDILAMLHRAEILTSDGGLLRFSYRYIYYFYAAKYIADHIERCGEEIEELCERMHSERNANILIFLMHHSRDQRVIDEVLLRAEMIFDGVTRATLDKEETGHILELLDDVPDLVLEHIDVEAERRRELKRRDDLEAEQPEEDVLEEDVASLDATVVDIVRSSRMVDVVGQILRNRSGSLERTQLTDLARSGYGTALRFLGFWLEFTRREKGEVVALIAGALQQETGRTKDEDKLRKAAMRFYLGLCYDVCRGVVRRVANSLGAKELIEIFEALEREEPESVTVKLINVAIMMEFTKSIPKRQIEKVAKAVHANPIARLLLRELVVQHLYLNETEVGERQWISAKLGIPMKAQRRLGSERAKRE